ncbi:hypothetical protein XA68_14375 [Ophiocordyceps unilateralis]|uniref:DUF3835 domain-containing protein n=1 Tax=Ophiocordyceps unilateralis TaxID=268505 RepID=A0A2A9PM00_OPHUN|nr:hypothetical protein XA68_14375 [Ophiocordyceps unilateralis]
MADDSERHRLQVQDSIEKLRNSLQHWLTWDAEYEALKEEVEVVSDDQTEELRRIHDGYEGELLRDRELDEIFGLQSPRSRRQIVNVLQRRIDYVTQNVETLRKRLDAEQSKHATTTAVAQPEGPEGDAETITDILEQLDDEDNVVSFRLHRPGDSLPQVREALEKAGVDDLEDGTQPPVDSPAGQVLPASTHVPVETWSKSPPAPNNHVAVQKPMMDPQEASNPPVEMSRRARRIDGIMRTAREQETISQQKPVIPEDEDPEDAALRRQMIQYGMRDIGAVVAELQLEEGDSDEDMDDVTEMDDDDDDGEDRYGRSTGRLVSDSYRQRMLELERKHGLESRFTRATNGEDQLSDGQDDEGIGRIKVKRQVSPSAAKAPPLKSSIKDKQGDADAKKGVRFAQSLDVAPDDEPAVPAIEEKEEPVPAVVVNPVSDIVERAGPGDVVTSATESKAPHRPSRFKQARDMTASSGAVPLGPLDVPFRFMDETRQETPKMPQDTTLAERLVEREPGSSPKPPDELDDSMSHSAVAGEHQRLRKRFIQRQGGFLQEDTSPVQLMEDLDDVSEPISRFKAARLSRK